MHAMRPSSGPSQEWPITLKAKVLMPLSTDVLQLFADRTHCGGSPPQHVRETLEASLIPVVRRALRTGAGLPQLVQWIQKTLPQVQSSQDSTRSEDPDRAAAPLARLLCASLLHQRPAGHAALETVVSR